MSSTQTSEICRAYFDYIRVKDFPCIGAKTAFAENQIQTLVVDHMGCPKDDVAILQFLYQFVDAYRTSKTFYHSAVIIFREPINCSEEEFDALLWKRLQSISDLDAARYDWDSRVEKDATSPDFSFSIREEAFYVIGLHSNSVRKARQFKYPALVFNPHDQFEKLRAANKYNRMKEVVRKRDMKFSSSVNPMLADFGTVSEAFQYSGVQHNQTWRCPFISKHKGSESSNDSRNGS